MLAASNTSVRNSTAPADPGGLTGPVQRSASENARSTRAVWVSSGIWVTCRSPRASAMSSLGLGGQVPPGQHHLDQRVVGQDAGGVEPLDDHFERHVLVLVGGQAARAHLGEQFGDGGITGHVDPQHQGVDEEARPTRRGRGRGARRSGIPPPRRSCR